MDRAEAWLTGVPDDTVSDLSWTPPTCPVNILAASSWDGTVRLWRMHRGANISEEPLAMTRDAMPLLSVSLTADGRCYMGGCGAELVEWNVTEGTTRVLGKHDLPISSVVHIPPSHVHPEMVASTSWDGTMCLWDTRQAAPAAMENFGGPIVRVVTSRGSAGGDSLAAVVLGRRVFLYDLASCRRFGEIHPHHLMRFNFRAAAIAPTTRTLWVGSSEGRIAVTNLSSLRDGEGGASAARATSRHTPSQCVKAHVAEMSHGRAAYLMYPCNAIAAHPTRPIVASGGSDGVVGVWAGGASRLAALPQRVGGVERVPGGVGGGVEAVPITAAAFSADGGMLAYAIGYDWSMGRGGYDPAGFKAVVVTEVPARWGV